MDIEIEQGLITQSILLVSYLNRFLVLENVGYSEILRTLTELIYKQTNEIRQVSNQVGWMGPGIP